MKKYLILAVIPFNVFATGVHHETNNPATTSLDASQVTSVNVGVKSDANSFASSKSIANGGTGVGTGYGEGGNATGGQGGNAINKGNSVNFNQVRQTPFAYSPGLAQSFSQDNCANTASVGVSAGFGAISGGAPVESDSCNRRKDVTLWLVTGQNRIACERMTDDDANMEAMKRAGMDCKSLTEIKPPVNVPENHDLTVFDKMDIIADEQLRQLANRRK